MPFWLSYSWLFEAAFSESRSSILVVSRCAVSPRHADGLASLGGTNMRALQEYIPALTRPRKDTVRLHLAGELNPIPVGSTVTNNLPPLSRHNHLQTKILKSWNNTPHMFLIPWSCGFLFENTYILYFYAKMSLQITQKMETPF